MTSGSATRARSPARAHWLADAVGRPHLCRPRAVQLPTTVLRRVAVASGASLGPSVRVPVASGLQ